jgi:hypothetical protein
MSTIELRFGAGSFALVIFLASSQARSEIPKFTLNNPIPAERYFNTSGIAVSGKVEPAIHTEVRVQLFHVLDNGELLSEGGASRYLDTDGRFSIDLEPRAGGWTPGKFRCVVTAGSHLLRQSVEIEMIDSGTKRTPIREPKDSGIQIDLSNPGDGPPQIPPGEMVRIRGVFVYGVPAHRHQGPSVSVELLFLNPLQQQPITAQTARALSFPEDAFTCSFDAELVAPDLVGDYLLHIRVPMRGADGKPQDQHFNSELLIRPRQSEAGAR